jgi:hypothetical protein
MLEEWVTVVPFGVPQTTAAATVTLADPDLLESSLLVAVMAYVPAVPEVNVAVSPLGVRVPPAGDAFQVTPFEQPELALTVAVKVEVAPAAIEVELAASVTPETVQPLLPFPPLLPQLERIAPPSTADKSSTSHPGARPDLAAGLEARPPFHDAILDMIRSSRSPLAFTASWWVAPVEGLLVLGRRAPVERAVVAGRGRPRASWRPWRGLKETPGQLPSYCASPAKLGVGGFRPGLA